MTGLSFEVVDEDERWGGEETLRQLVDRACVALGALSVLRGGEAQFTILFTSDSQIQELNRQWRGQDKPTNVLSFPAAQDGNPEFSNYIGDIAIAYETIVREAQEYDKVFEDHVLHMIVHGILHLLGHDHENDAEAEIMEDLERKILAKAGIGDPYK